MLSVAAIMGVASLALLLGITFHVMRKLGAQEIAVTLIAITAIGFALALAGTMIS